MTTYTLNWQNDVLKAPFTLAPNTVDSTSTSLTLTGRGVSNWGEKHQENLIRLLEHFASDVSPTHATLGQLWFKSTDKKLYVYHTDTWNELANRRIDSGTTPTGPNYPGDLWYDTASDVLKVYTNATTWVPLEKAVDLFLIAEELTPPQITANQNNYNPANFSTSNVLRLSTNASRDITGLASGVQGRVVMIHNVGTNPIVLKNENASSTAANRFALNADVTISQSETLTLRYDGASSRWRLWGPNRVNFATDATNATNATNATTAAFATNAGNATTATNATNATLANAISGQQNSATIEATTTATANRIVLRDANKDIFVNAVFAETANNENPTVSQVMVTNGTDNKVRKASLAHVLSAAGIWTSSNDGSGSGLDADLLDGLNETVFMRKNRGADATAVDTMIQTPGTYNGVSQRDNNGPVGYAWGGLINLSSTDSRFQLYVSHHASSGDVNQSGPYFRSGWGTDLKSWRQLWHDGNDGASSGLDADLWDGAQFTDYLNQAVKTTSSPTFDEVIATNWFRNTTSGEGLKNDATTNTWFSDGGYWNVAYAGNAGVRVRVTAGGSGTIAGALFGNTSQEFGLQNNLGNWVVRANSGNNTGGFLENGTWTANGGTIWSAGNDGPGSGLDADTVDGIHASGLMKNATDAVDNLYIRNAAPTVFLRDTEHRSGMLRVDGGTFYVLRANGADSITEQSLGGYWPLAINLENNVATFGATPNVQGTSVVINSGTWSISVTGNAGTVTNGVYNNGGTYGINITGSAADSTRWAGGARLVSTGGPSGGSDNDVWFRYA